VLCTVYSREGVYRSVWLWHSPGSGAKRPVAFKGGQLYEGVRNGQEPKL